MDPLFPALPEDLNTLSDEEIDALENEHVAALQMIREDNREFTGDRNAVQVVEQATIGRTQLQTIRDHKATLAAAQETYLETIAELTSDVAEPVVETVEPTEDEPELAAELSEPAAEEIEALVEEPAEPVLAAALPMRRPPAPSRERQPLPEPERKVGASLVAAGYAHDWIAPGTEFDPADLSKVVIEKARRLGKPKKHETGSEEKYLLASATFEFPSERVLDDNIAENGRKIRALANAEGRSLVASGGLCAPLENIYTIPQFATNARPVRAALPSFMASRGGVNVPIPTTLASAFDAITIITEAEDALGGTFATKSCLDQTCLEFVETAVTIISHCREYGNLNARAWPESITFENDLTMAEHARVAEGYLLDRIKAQSINVTTPDVYSSTWDLINAAARAVTGIRYRLRTGPDFRFRALFPEWIREMTVADIAGTQFDRFVGTDKFSQVMRAVGVEPSFYLDTPSTGTSQGYADETAGVLDEFPDYVQWALFPEGAFIHVDGGQLELGLVRDSTLNSTNDFQFFGETFENVARLGPVQSALWITSAVCPSGEFPALTTALSC